MSIPARWSVNPEARTWRRDACSVVVAFFLLMAWDMSGIDLPIERLFGTPVGFALRDSRWAIASYDLGREVAWVVVPLLIASLWLKMPVFGKVTRSQRLWWLLTTVICLLVIPLLRSRSGTSCPWSLAEFGGGSPYVSHWWRAIDAGPGKCFPSGHASTGFAFVAGFFVLRHVDRRMAGWWLTGALAFGTLAAVTQTMRGAHFVSHSLWTLWICWTLTVVSWHAMRSLVAIGTRRASRHRMVVAGGAPLA